MEKQIFIACWAVWGIFGLTSAQNQFQLDAVVASTDTLALQQFQPVIRAQMEADLLQAQWWALQNGYPLSMPASNGGSTQVFRPLRDDFYEYIGTDNAISAQTISTDELHFGGNLNLNLTGAGYTAWIWDEGSVHPHQEFAARSDTGRLGDFAAESNHATHVAGTIISSGSYVPASKGMAPAAHLRFETIANDISEMMSGASIGVLISNHSYSVRMGWIIVGNSWWWLGDLSISSTEDYRFGFYNSDAEYYDFLAYHAPYYLIVKSAGNNRLEVGPPPGGAHYIQTGGQWVLDSTVRNPDGPYDCLAYRAVAKNNLVVGAVKDIPGGYTTASPPQMTTFSGWGPTDDGRIKPDIVTNGHQVFSTIDTTGYAVYSGTSMSTPAATGYILLLQEYYAITHNYELMRSATAKALVIHTADEAGAAPGPDYQHGWGLMNTETAAEKIARDVADPGLIQESILVPGDTFGYDFTYSGNAEPFIKATLVWTDLPGTPVAPQLNPTDPMLVNDLDLRVYALGPPEAEYRPWILDPNNPANPAIRGDNFRDNVELVQVDNPVSGGNYRVTVTHKGPALANNLPQAFSLVLSGVENPATAATEAASDFSVAVYPSPARDRVTFDLRAADFSRAVRLEIWSGRGHKLLERELPGGAVTDIGEIAAWAAGLYVYRLTDRKGRMAMGKVQKTD
ncbi:MAG: S8 family serine peptidase [Bacteroidota bacterium]